MEFFIGSVFTLITVVVVNLLVRSQLKQNKDKTIIRYSQSHIHNLVKPFLPPSSFMKPVKQSQAIKHKQSQFLRVMVLDGKAYWIRDQALYTADVSDGRVNQDTAKKVDTMAMSKVELDKVIFVVEQLTDGSENDFGNPGKSIF